MMIIFGMLTYEPISSSNTGGNSRRCYKNIESLVMIKRRPMNQPLQRPMFGPSSKESSPQKAVATGGLSVPKIVIKSADEISEL